MQKYSAVLATKWIWCSAVPLLFASIFPEAFHQVWIGALQGSPSPCPLLQPPHPTLGSADEVWPEERQSLLGWRGEYIVSCLLVGRMPHNSLTLILLKEKKKIFIGLESFLKISLTLENPLHSLVIARRYSQHGNIMLSFSGDKGKRALLTGGIRIFQKASQTSPDQTC